MFEYIVHQIYNREEKERGWESERVREWESERVREWEREKHTLQIAHLFVCVCVCEVYGYIVYHLCNSVLQCVAVCCSVLQCVAVCCSVLQCVAVCCRVLQCVAATSTVCVRTPNPKLCIPTNYTSISPTLLDGARGVQWEKSALDLDPGFSFSVSIFWVGCCMLCVVDLTCLICVFWAEDTALFQQAQVLIRQANARKRAWFE